MRLSSDRSVNFLNCSKTKTKRNENKTITDKHNFISLRDENDDVKFACKKENFIKNGNDSHFVIAFAMLRHSSMSTPVSTWSKLKHETPRQNSPLLLYCIVSKSYSVLLPTWIRNAFVGFLIFSFEIFVFIVI